MEAVINQVSTRYQADTKQFVSPVRSQGNVDEAEARSLFSLRMALAAKRPFPQASGTLAWRTQDLTVEHVPGPSMD